MAEDLSVFNIIEPCPAKAGVAEDEPARLDDVDWYIETRSEPDEGGRILRNVWLEQGDTHEIFLRLSTSCPIMNMKKRKFLSWPNMNH
jgi:hypothetical protein